MALIEPQQELREKEQRHLTQILPYEIECPRCCAAAMKLRTDFSTPFYNCIECDFILDAIQKNKKS
jgi:hypothetical protein